MMECTMDVQQKVEKALVEGVHVQHQQLPVWTQLKEMPSAEEVQVQQL